MHEYKELIDRFIVDKGMSNETERFLGWTKLPAGSQLCALFLKPHQTVCGSTDDFKIYLFLVLGVTVSAGYNPVGRNVGGSALHNIVPVLGPFGR